MEHSVNPLVLFNVPIGEAPIQGEPSVYQTQADQSFYYYFFFAYHWLHVSTLWLPCYSFHVKKKPPGPDITDTTAASSLTSLAATSVYTL